jgi:hypothetical protein
MLDDGLSSALARERIAELRREADAARLALAAGGRAARRRTATPASDHDRRRHATHRQGARST